MMDRRQWMYDKLTGDSVFNDGNPGGIFGSSMEETPVAKPFTVIRGGDDTPQAVVGLFQNVSLWIHDEPGSYENIDSLVSRALAVLVGPIEAVDGIYCEWVGTSGDLADDTRKTIVKNVTFRLAGRR